jgi:hypothetical protein
LLGIANQEKRAGSRAEPGPVGLLRVRAREIEQDLRLDGVGILELVDQEAFDPPLKIPADLGVVAKQGGGEKELVPEVQL